MRIPDLVHHAQRWDDRLAAMEQTLEVRMARAKLLYDVCDPDRQSVSDYTLEVLEPPRTDAQQALVERFLREERAGIEEEVERRLKAWLEAEGADAADVEAVLARPGIDRLRVLDNEVHPEDQGDMWEQEWGFRFDRFTREQAEAARKAYWAEETV